MEETSHNTQWLTPRPMHYLQKKFWNWRKNLYVHSDLLQAGKNNADSKRRRSSVYSGYSNISTLQQYTQAEDVGTLH